MGFLLGLWIMVALPLISFAIEPGDIPKANDLIPSAPSIENKEGLLGILGNVVGIVYKVFFIIAVLFILIAAFNYLTAGGNEEKIKTAHKQITWAAVAIVVALLSVSFSIIIQNFIGTKSGGGANYSEPEPSYSGPSESNLLPSGGEYQGPSDTNLLPEGGEYQGPSYND